MNTKKYFLLISIILITIAEAYSEHIVGGEVTYKCLGINSSANTARYEFVFTIYIDRTSSTNFDPSADFGIYSGSDDNWTFVRSVFNLRVEDTRRIRDIGSNPCLVAPKNIRIEKGVYRFEVELPIIDENYLVVHQACCRTPDLTNIVNPEEVGAAFNVLISPEAQASCNNSPTFDDFPPIVLCLNEDIFYTQSATDVDGDILTYELCAPLVAGGPNGQINYPGFPEDCIGISPDPEECLPPFAPIEYVSPTYSDQMPLGNNANFSVDLNTGQFFGRPRTQGQFEIGVCVKEFRDGVMIGQIQRDFQFNVLQCGAPVTARVEADAKVGDQFTINSCSDGDLTIINTSFEEEDISNYQWKFEIADSTIVETSKDLNLSLPGAGQYTGEMVVNRTSACPDTAFVTVNIFPDIKADFTYSYDSCDAGPVLFVDNSELFGSSLANVEWYFSTDTITSLGNVQYLFPNPGSQFVAYHIVDSNTCSDTITKEIIWSPAPSIIIAEPSAFDGCLPAVINFNNLSYPIDETYDIVWDFGGLGSSDEISPSFTFDRSGIYDVTVEITSPEGCIISKVFEDWINIYESPFADFDYNPPNPDYFNREVSFNNLSIGEISIQWNFGDVGLAFDDSPIFTFPDTGRYQVELVAVNELGCADTLTQILEINAISNIQIPNAFTPNNDGLNDEFISKGSLQLLNDYEFMVFNRWGEVVFATEDPLEGWNGRMNNRGAESARGVYMYILKYMDNEGQETVKKGHVTLIR